MEKLDKPTYLQAILARLILIIGTGTPLVTLGYYSGWPVTVACIGSPILLPIIGGSMIDRYLTPMKALKRLGLLSLFIIVPICFGLPFILGFMLFGESLWAPFTGWSILIGGFYLFKLIKASLSKAR